MGPKKLTRVVLHRKWLIAGVALVGAIIGYLVASGMNESREPLFEGVATIEFGSPTDDRTRDPAEEDELAQALVAAEAANEGLIRSGLGRVTSSPQSGLLLFTSRATDEAVAEQRAEEMRTAYLESTTEDTAQDRQQRLEEIVTEASAIQAQLDELNPPPPEEEPELEVQVDPDVVARLELLDALAVGLVQQQTRLEIDLVLAEAGDERVGQPEDIREELNGVADRLDEVQAEIAQISADNDLSSAEVTRIRDQSQDQGEETAASSDPRSTELPTEARTPEEIEALWTIDALQSRYEELAAEYEALFVENTIDTPVELTAIQVEDRTPSRASVQMLTGLGLVLGAVAAVALAFGEAMWSRRVYVLADAEPVNGLAELPAARGLITGRPGLRVASESPRRAEGIHRLRIALMGFMGSDVRTPVVGMTRAGIDHDQTAILTTDLARRLAASGRSVLVLDVDFGTEPLYPVASASTTVADLISAARIDHEMAATQMKRAFTEVTSTEAYRLIRSGTLVEDPADVFLTDSFRMLLDVAREQADIVMIVASDAENPSTFSLKQSLDGVIGVCSVGRTRRGGLLKLAQPDSGVGPPMGLVLITGWAPKGRGRGRFSDLASTLSRPFKAIRARFSRASPAGDSPSEHGA